ncbi:MULTISPECIES: extracellular solute-binding protein [unclassified Thermoactinomyces]|jgi:iron(III) transport system substrate-binding protein|uniref:extracellular solute-binding protein n=1 Tax=unclassified Thermoactinomyces TaxID=2634588 RepID=UPI0018DB8285|nr:MULTISPECIES: extracellular solute-binding protein [unclassified Thermoactinomyces]MBH8596924.1 extracellular solute-binding protein [Thermoactinomyces sp. CICC 10523]MBH8603700.1 extracellular solute-binding protein [Thermoactinomyces sp. CICC 10522]MBH8607665.1 extracellular solute-binding protein [Thermoactinomyces sp. CICC 10521]
MKKRWRCWLSGALVFLFVTGCLATTPPSADKGGLEEKVVVYSPHGKEILQEFEKRFEQAHPHVDVEWLDIGSQEILDRVRSERENPQADVWWGAPSVMFEKAREEGLLQPYHPSYSKALPRQFRAVDDSWTGTSQTPEVIMYNSQKVSPSEAPKDWDDLLDPKWKGKIIIRYPLASGTMRTIFSAMIYRFEQQDHSPQKGYEWLRKLDANTHSYAANPEIMYNQIARGEGVITVWDMPDTVMLKEKKHYPFDYVIPKSGTPVLTEGIAIIKGAKHPKAAEAFYEFVNTQESMRYLAEQYYRIPTRTDVTGLPEWIKDSKITPMDLDFKLVQAKEQEWMNYWEQNIKNKSK